MKKLRFNIPSTIAVDIFSYNSRSLSELQVSDDRRKRSMTMAQSSERFWKRLWLVKEIVSHGETAKVVWGEKS